MDRMFARRMFQISPAAGSDQVFCGIDLPSETVVHDIHVSLSFNNQLAKALNEVTGFAIAAWILPVTDPDAEETYDAVLDRLVSKDTDVETMDLDTGAADTSPFWEPGEIDLQALFDVGVQPRRIYHKSVLLSIARGSIFTFQDNQTPFAIQYLGGGSMAIRIRRRMRVSQPSVLVFAVSNPAMDDTTTDLPKSLAEAAWHQIKYIRHVLERAVLHVLGVVEAGAETPWEEATALVKSYLDPDIYEQDGGAFISDTINIRGQAIFDLSVVGTLGRTAITTGR